MVGIVKSYARVLAPVILSWTLFLTGSENAWSANAAQFDSTRLVLRLSPIAQGAGTPSWQSGKSGRPTFDRAMEAHHIAEIRPAFRTGNEPDALKVHSQKLRLSDFVVISVPAGIDPVALRSELNALPDVEKVELEAIAHIAGMSVTPNDPYFATHQYSLRNTGTQPPYDPGTAGADAEMEAAWAITTGDTSVIIGIIDTGVDIGHPDLTDHIWINPLEDEDFTDNDGNGYVDDIFGYDFVNNDGVPVDDHMHGTHLAGIAGGIGNNGIGIAGMNWQCRIMAVKVLNMDGSGTFTAIANGIKYAVDMGADIVNLSLGGPSDQMALKAAIDYAIAAGVIVCAATGNDNSGAHFYPAAYDSVIAVGATDSRDRRALGDLCPFEVQGSNYGPWIDVCAAGDVVWSTFPAAEGNYGIYCLTSMASPHVAGLASLILALRPAMSPDSIAHYIRRGAEDQVGLPLEDTPGFDIYHGWGRINGRITLQALAFEFDPVITVPGPQNVTELDTLTFLVSTFDSNLTDPQVSVNAPLNSTLTPQGMGVWEFAYAPGPNDAGLYQIEFIATDVDGNADTGYVEVTVLEGCVCDCHGDPGGPCDGFTNILDVTQVVNAAFRNYPPMVDPNANCPHQTPDVNCSGDPEVLDVVKMVNVAFRNGNPAVEFCNPCP